MLGDQELDAALFQSFDILGQVVETDQDRILPFLPFQLLRDQVNTRVEGDDVADIGIVPEETLEDSPVEIGIVGVDVFLDNPPGSS